MHYYALVRNIKNDYLIVPTRYIHRLHERDKLRPIENCDIHTEGLILKLSGQQNQTIKIMDTDGKYVRSKMNNIL